MKINVSGKFRYLGTEVIYDRKLGQVKFEFLVFMQNYDTVKIFKNDENAALVKNLNEFDKVTLDLEIQTTGDKVFMNIINLIKE